MGKNFSLGSKLRKIFFFESFLRSTSKSSWITGPENKNKGRATVHCQVRSTLPLQGQSAAARQPLSLHDPRHSALSCMRARLRHTDSQTLH